MLVDFLEIILIKQIQEIYIYIYIYLMNFNQ